MLLEFLSHLVSFDLAWIAALILSNLHWAFALFAFTFIGENGKRPVWHFLILIAMLYAFGDILGLGGWILTPFILVIPFQLLIGCSFPEGSWPRRNFTKIVMIFLMVTIFINTFYFRFPGGY